MTSRNHTAIWLICLSVLLLSTALLLSSQRVAVPSVRDEVPSETQVSPIIKSLPDPKFAGIYDHANGYEGRTLHLMQNGMYQLRYWQDTTVVDDPKEQRHRSIGQWSVRGDGAVVITPTDAAQTPRLLDKPLVFYPVRWGPRLYLVEEDKFPQFSAAIRDGSEPRRGLRSAPFLLRHGVPAEPATGLPEFPVRWRSLLDGLRSTTLVVGVGGSDNDKRHVYTELVLSGIPCTTDHSNWPSYIRIRTRDVARARKVLRSDSDKHSYSLAFLDQ